MSLLQGSFDGFSEGVNFYGWVVDRENPGFSGIEVFVELDEKVRSDPVPAQLARGDGYHGFHLRMLGVIESSLILNGRVKVKARIPDSAETEIELKLYPPTREKIEVEYIQNCLANIRSREAKKAALLALTKSTGEGQVAVATVDFPKEWPKEDELSSVCVRLGTTSADKTAVVGRNGYVFLLHGTNDVDGFYRLNAQDPYVTSLVDRWTALIQKRALSAESEGARFLQLIIPDKNSLYPWHLPSQVETPTRVLCGTEAGIDNSFYLSCLKALQSSERLDSCYFRTDSHISPTGSWEIVSAILSKFGIEQPMSMSYESLFSDQQIFSGDIVQRLYGVPLFETYRTVGKDGFRDYTRGLKLIKEYAPERGHDGMNYVWRNESAPINLKVVAFANSYFERGGEAHSLSWWFKHLFREFHFLWSAPFNSDYVRTEKPDIVICQTVERFLRSCPNA